MAYFAPLSISNDDDQQQHASTMMNDASLNRRNRMAAQQREPVVVATGTVVDLPASPYPRQLQIPEDDGSTMRNNGDSGTNHNNGDHHHHSYETTHYRGGFSTSLCDLFQDPRDRASCCALTCGGTFLQDRTRYLLTGELPPPWWMRIVGYGGGLTISWVLGQLLLGQSLWSWIPPLVFLMVMLIRGTALRQQLRQKLQLRMLQERPDNHQQSNTHSTTTPYLSTRSEHWCCSLVSNDKRRTLVTAPQTRTQVDDRDYLERQRRQQADCCFRLWQCLAKLCCDTCCLSWCQWCGMCATGQEDRELRRLLPPQVFLRDFITFQPFGDYYPPIEWVRQDRKVNFKAHLGALSQLSQKLLQWLSVALLLLLAVATFHIVTSFSIGKVFVVVATLAQAFFVLYWVYWKHHRFDVSLDAIIKFFASGFVLAMTVALVVELILDVLGEVIFGIVLTNEYIDDHPEILTMDDDYAIHHAGPFSDYATFKTMAQKHYMTLLVYLFFKAVVVAALVEELTKYFCFWMVEHPDYSYGAPRHVNVEWGEESAFFNDTVVETVTFSDAADSATTRFLESQPTNHASSVLPPASPSEAATSDLPPFRPRPKPTHTTAGAAITVGMIATAAGFACSENLMYVFSQNSVAGELTVLMARSALPVHSLCAAIQSIGVVRRDVEQDTDYKIGWAILPAVLLHGMFDFILLSLSMMEFIWADDDSSSSNPNGYNTNSPDNNDALHDDLFGPQHQQSQSQEEYSETIAQQMIGFSVGAAIAMVGVLYYVNEAGKQRHRLQALEMTTAQVPSTAGLVFT